MSEVGMENFTGSLRGCDEERPPAPEPAECPEAEVSCAIAYPYSSRARRMTTSLLTYFVVQQVVPERVFSVFW